jgi:hypothetical protein
MAKICSIEGCGKPAYTRGWCAAHYFRFRRHGDPLGGRMWLRESICAAEGCVQPILARGWCVTHYSRFRRHGDPLGGGPYITFDGRRKHPLWGIWHMMISRCHYEDNESFHRYGGRGIQVCAEWRNDFWAFVRDIPPRPSPKHTLGRIDNNKGYSPGNVEWQTYAKQNRNYRRNVFLTIDGRTQVMADWADERGIIPSTIRKRLKRGWSERDAVMKPLRQHR